jgi:hypothetical protein
MSITLPPLLAHAERHWVTPGRLESAATALAAMTRARATRARVARLLPVLAMVEQAMPGLRGLPDRAFVRGPTRIQPSPPCWRRCVKRRCAF